MLKGISTPPVRKARWGFGSMNTIFIDGENFKYRIKDVFDKYRLSAPVWHIYDFHGLFTSVLDDYAGYKREEKRFYVAKPKPHKDIPDVSARMIETYRSLGGHLHRQGFEVITAGRVRADYKNSSDKKPTFREKGVDVRIAVDMVAMAYDRNLKKALLVASDSDYQPAVTELRKRGVTVIYVGFEINPNLGLIAKTNDRIIISNKSVLQAGGVTWG